MAMAPGALDRDKIIEQRGTHHRTRSHDSRKRRKFGA
jgi:hypothetical protein